MYEMELLESGDKPFTNLLTKGTSKQKPNVEY